MKFINKLIPGFLLGMQWMNIQEIRELFIHPSIGYGIYTFLDKGIYLKVQVKFIELLDLEGIAFSICISIWSLSQNIVEKFLIEQF